MTILLCHLYFQKEGKAVCAVDEIGKMELFSSQFAHIVHHLFDNPKYAVIATLPIQRGRPITLVEEIRNRKDVTLFNVSVMFVFLLHVTGESLLTQAVVITH